MSLFVLLLTILLPTVARCYIPFLLTFSGLPLICSFFSYLSLSTSGLSLTFELRLYRTYKVFLSVLGFSSVVVNLLIILDKVFFFFFGISSTLSYSGLFVFLLVFFLPSGTYFSVSCLVLFVLSWVFL